MRELPGRTRCGRARGGQHGPGVKRYDRHFLWVFLQSLALVLALFTTVFLVVDVLVNLDKIQEFSDITRGALLFYGYNLPPIMNLLFPFAVFGAGMFSVARIIRARELLLLEASGVSPRRALAAVVIPCFLLGVCGLALRQFVLPDLSMAARESPYGAFEFRKGKRVTVRDDDGNVWFVRRYNLDERSLEGVRILHSGGTQMLVADGLRWLEERGQWRAPGRMVLYDLAALTAPSGEGVEGSALQGNPPFGRLYPADFARRKRGYSDRTLLELWHEGAAGHVEMRLNLWHELWHPFGGFILLLCGIGLVTGSAGRGMIRAGSLALLCVVGYQISLFWFETLAQSGAFGPEVGAGITPVAFSILGLWVFGRN